MRTRGSPQALPTPPAPRTPTLCRPPCVRVSLPVTQWLPPGRAAQRLPGRPGLRLWEQAHLSWETRCPPGSRGQHFVPPPGLATDTPPSTVSGMRDTSAPRTLGGRASWAAPYTAGGHRDPAPLGPVTRLAVGVHSARPAAWGRAARGLSLLLRVWPCPASTSPLPAASALAEPPPGRFAPCRVAPSSGACLSGLVVVTVCGASSTLLGPGAWA